MKLAVGHVPQIAAEYFDNVLIPAASKDGGIRAFMVGFLGGVVVKNAGPMVEQYLPMSKAIGIVDENNLLDLDLVYEQATKALQRGPVIVSGYKVDQSDFDSIYQIARRYAQ